MSMGKVRALVIDDEKSIRKTLGRALEDMGLDVETAATGEEGLEKAGSGEYSIVMLDLKLPGVGGLEVLRQLREHTPPIPVVIISAHGTVDSAVDAMRLGAADFVQKPFSLEEIRAVAGEVLTRSDLPEDATDYDGLMRLARGAVTRKEFELAESFASKAISAGASRPEAYNLLGFLHEMRGERIEAMKFYRAALDMDPTYAQARANFERQ